MAISETTAYSYYWLLPLHTYSDAICPTHGISLRPLPILLYQQC